MPLVDYKACYPFLTFFFLKIQVQPSCGTGSSCFSSALFASIAEIQPSAELPSRLCWDFFGCLGLGFLTKQLGVSVGAEWKQSKVFNRFVDKCLGQVSYRVLGNSSCENAIKVPSYL